MSDLEFGSVYSYDVGAQIEAISRRLGQEQMISEITEAMEIESENVGKEDEDMEDDTAESPDRLMTIERIERPKYFKDEWEEEARSEERLAQIVTPANSNSSQLY